MKQKIINFIEANGWIFNGDDSVGEYQSFVKTGCYDIDVGNTEFVMVDETGDFMHVSYSAYSHYTLLGFLIHYNQITMGYNYPA